ncbi:hypothetical protein CC80DRAFT_99799 [Byssothecium circinans]|uniref:Uncharacterized protein n=1 Tax=Byssothecium circinans TaxID=147558 RepID=A0A6A5UGL1_9PLEO|nr:hypothetical protein CC80DRAFT_99799 [Byssothecium circinans]
MFNLQLMCGEGNNLRYVCGTPKVFADGIAQIIFAHHPHSPSIHPDRFQQRNVQGYLQYHDAHHCLVRRLASILNSPSPIIHTRPRSTLTVSSSGMSKGIFNIMMLTTVLFVASPCGTSVIS